MGREMGRDFRISTAWYGAPWPVYGTLIRAQMCRPVTFVLIELYLPRISEGASGFMSKLS